MNILAIDTTTKIASVAIKIENNIIEKEVDNKITHSEKLLPLIDETLNESKIKISDIDMFACISGPGSFTGIRIGLATIKAFSHVLNKNIFAISTLESLAITVYEKSKNYENKKTSYIASFIDARNERVYFSIYKLYVDTNNKIVCESLSDISNSNIFEAIEKAYETFTEINIQNDFIIFCGDIIDNYKENIVNKFKSENNNILFYNTYPKTADILFAIDNLANYNNYLYDTFSLDAIYARLSQAERTQNE